MTENLELREAVAREVLKHTIHHRQSPLDSEVWSTEVRDSEGKRLMLVRIPDDGRPRKSDGVYMRPAIYWRDVVYDLPHYDTGYTDVRPVIDAVLKLKPGVVVAFILLLIGESAEANSGDLRQWAQACLATGQAEATASALAVLVADPRNICRAALAVVRSEGGSVVRVGG